MGKGEGEGRGIGEEEGMGEGEGDGEGEGPGEQIGSHGFPQSKEPQQAGSGQQKVDPFDVKSETEGNNK